MMCNGMTVCANCGKLVHALPGVCELCGGEFHPATVEVEGQVEVVTFFLLFDVTPSGGFGPGRFHRNIQLYSILKNPLHHLPPLVSYVLAGAE